MENYISLETSNEPNIIVLTAENSENEENKQNEKNSGRPFTNTWDHFKRLKKLGGGHYSGSCNYCGKYWSRAKPKLLRVYLANHCNGSTLPYDLKMAFTRIIANENAKREIQNSDSDNEYKQNQQKKKKIKEIHKEKTCNL